MPKFTVYGRPNCIFCDKAKALLDKKGAEYAYIDIYQDVAAKAFVLGEGHTQVPQIYIKDVSVGGFTDLEMYFS